MTTNNHPTTNIAPPSGAPARLTKEQELQVNRWSIQLAHQRADLDALKVVARFSKYPGYVKPCVLFDEMAGQVSKFPMR